MAMNWDGLKTRYLQSDRTSQLESITLNLARIQTLASHDEEGSVARHLVRESQFFIEWTVPTIDLALDIEIATELVDLQRQLSAWKLDWDALWANESDRLALAQTAKQWGDRLQMSMVS
jgi:hypothetical protein